MPAGTAAGMGGCIPLFQGGTSLADSVEDGAAAVHPKPVIRSDVLQQFLADGAFQMHQGSAGHAFQVKMVTAIPLPHVLVDVGGLGIAPILPRKPLVAQLREMAIHGTPAAGLTVLPIHFGTKLLHRKLAVGSVFQKFQQPLSPRRFIYARHGIPPFGTVSCSIQV